MASRPDSVAPAWGRRLVLLLLPVALTAALLLVPLPRAWHGGWRSTLFDLGHVPLFVALTLALGVILRVRWYWPVLLAIVIAGLGEWLQSFVSRSADVMDFLRGAASALAAGTVLRAWQGPRTRARLALHGLAALAFLAWPIANTAPRLLDAYEGWRAFPTLADFDAPRRLLRWGCQQATLERVPSAQFPGKWDARLEFHPGPERYPGAGLEHVLRDFSGYRRICWAFTVEGEPLTLHFSLRGDPKRQADTPHYDSEQTFSPGTHVATIDLAVAADRARPGRLDLSQVWRSLVFVIEPDRRRTVYLHRVWLE